MTQDDLGGLGPMPDWVPAAARNYLSHTEAGRSIRALARESGVHASTILRQVRRIETRRDDPLVDAAILALARIGAANFPETTKKDPKAMTNAKRVPPEAAEDDTDREGRRILRRLLEPGALLAVAPDMEKAVVVRDMPDGRTLRTATMERGVAEAMALRDWIELGSDTGRIRRYRISPTGRTALKRLMAQEENASAGFAEAQAPFDGMTGERHRQARDEAPPRRGTARYHVAESPVAALARRQDRDGAPFLSDELLAAAERLREDFELSQLGPKVTQNWEGLLTGGVESSKPAEAVPAYGPAAARERFRAALTELGPGLGDVALRCCCYLEGLETAERRLGWSSRSAKIVLRIALQRLRRHYEETGGLYGVLIG